MECACKYSTYLKTSTLFALEGLRKKIWMSDVPRKKTHPDPSKEFQRSSYGWMSRTGSDQINGWDQWVIPTYYPLILAIDPITSWDIQVSTTVLSSVFWWRWGHNFRDQVPGSKGMIEVPVGFVESGREWWKRRVIYNGKGVRNERL